jgi:hypothetical protein
LVGALGVEDVVDRVDLGLSFGQRVGEWLLVEVTGQGRVRPIACILSCTLMGPGSSPEASRAARTCSAWSLTSSLSFDRLDWGRRDLGSSTAAGPSAAARLRSS